MSPATLERHQVWIYLAAIAAGLALGQQAGAMAPAFEAALWPALALLLFATFVPVPLLHLREAVADRRFAAAVVVGNFVALPLLALALVHTLPADAALRLGVLMVLLVPCTDWFITFAQLGRGDAARAVAVTPLNLLLQLALLPAYLALMAGESLRALWSVQTLVPAAGIVALPLALAIVAGHWIEAKPVRVRWRVRLAWAPVPLLALVVFLIAAAQVRAVAGALHLVPVLVPVFAAFALLAAVLAWVLARWLALPAAQGRTLAYSLGTRNSFVVLPFALALPAGWEVAAVVIVLQSLVELFAMLGYLAWLPRLIRDTPPAPR